MLVWTSILLAAGSIIVLATLLLVISWRCYGFKEGDSTGSPAGNLQVGNGRLNQGSLNHRQLQSSSKTRGNYYVFPRDLSTKSLFNWADHPSLITDAVENGWSRFAFRGYMSSSPSTRSSLLGLCAAGDYYGNKAEPEISWEVCQGSADFVQKIRLNPGLKKVNVNSAGVSAASVIRTALPLPGPPLGNSAFPQEAYFEITILYCHGCCDDHESAAKAKEGEKTKLIPESSNLGGNSSESLRLAGSGHRINKIEELKLSDKDDGKDKALTVSLGLTTGGPLPSKPPGRYPGSIGFHSNGSVYLDGVKIVFETEKAEWAKTDRVIGCGFDPRQTKVFFTVDSELIHVVHCKSQEFGTPLYPTIAANNDIIVLVNFGQSAFSYAPANSQRTPNPCFIGPLANSPALGYEDSTELFSMGRIDSQWLNRSATKTSHLNGTNNLGVDCDEESEADLFEIVLDSRSPSIVLQQQDIKRY
uniref:SPRY domain-containing protein n=1 Tax=Rhizophora mucronata TaxID=61149 RepID=A0A2P2J9I1_RHIMU